MSTGIDTLFGRRYSYFIVQMVGCCNVIYRGGKNRFYLFDPYPINKRGKPVEDGRAGWIRYKSLKQVKRRLRKEAFKTGGLYSFYTFEVTSIKKAPKGILVGENLHLYQLEKPKKKEKIEVELSHNENGNIRLTNYLNPIFTSLMELAVKTVLTKILSQYEATQ
ncbi:hypothetical protein HHI36_022361 [Cryptolaemus montrouzieri]|uniref:Uncharacterized protein n=1 Tax=Cryptolaemus montrouzieri TaxID=559131 RepID=A0ABD2MZV2_9CUCU